MEHIRHEYSIWLWSRVRQKYIYIYNSTRSTYEDCMRDFQFKKNDESSWKYTECDWDNYQVRYRKVVTTDWEVIHD